MSTLEDLGRGESFKGDTGKGLGSVMNGNKQNLAFELAAII